MRQVLEDEQMQGDDWTDGQGEPVRSGIVERTSACPGQRTYQPELREGERDRRELGRQTGSGTEVKREKRALDRGIDGQA